jgi:hypothetical protein
MSAPASAWLAKQLHLQFLNEHRAGVLLLVTEA